MKKKGVVNLRSNKYVYISIILALLIIPIVSANISDFLNIITGKAASDTTVLNITISNTGPIITGIEAIASQSITLETTTNVTFSFNVSDDDGEDDINASLAVATFNLTPEITRTNNATCINATVNASIVNITCTIAFAYFDGNGDWTINVSVRDLGGTLVENTSTTVTLDATTGMSMSPTSLAWNSLSMASTNSEATSNITINNTANTNISSPNVAVTANNLQGNETNSSQFIAAADFTVHTVPGCGGTAMVNASATGVVGATLPKGNTTLGTGEGQEGLYFCLEQVTAGISQQSYTTNGENSSAWTIAVS